MNFDVSDYRRRLRNWRARYDGVSQSIRVLKRDAAQSAKVGSNTGAYQRALVVLQDEARYLLEVRSAMKDEWVFYNAPRVVFIGVVLGDSIFS